MESLSLRYFFCSILHQLEQVWLLLASVVHHHKSLCTLQHVYRFWKDDLSLKFKLQSCLVCSIVGNDTLLVDQVLRWSPFKDFSKPLNDIYAPWFNFWPHKFSIREILENLTLLTAPSNSINNVTWSIYYEIYGSLFLPLFYWFNKKTNFGLQFLLLVTLIYCGKHEVFLPVSPVLRYLYCFYLGSFFPTWNFEQWSGGKHDSSSWFLYSLMLVHKPHKLLHVRFYGLWSTSNESLPIGGET